jgi:hypothetical protein
MHQHLHGGVPVVDEGVEALLHEVVQRDPTTVGVIGFGWGFNRIGHCVPLATRTTEQPVASRPPTPVFDRGVIAVPEVAQVVGCQATDVLVRDIVSHAETELEAYLERSGNDVKSTYRSTNDSWTRYLRRAGLIEGFSPLESLIPSSAVARLPSSVLPSTATEAMPARSKTPAM